jgi:hypothetical protein
MRIASISGTVWKATLTMALSCFARAALGSTIAVDSTSDTAANDGGCTLRLRQVLRTGCSLALLLLFALEASGEARRGIEERTRERLSGVRIPFIVNAGQTDPAVAYYAPTFAGMVFVTRDGGIVYSLPGLRSSSSGLPSAGRSPDWSLTETLVGGRARPGGSERASTAVNYFLGNDPTRWRSGLETFNAVSLGEVWPGISLALRAHGSNVEKLFTVEPGGDPSRIRVRVGGGLGLRVGAGGALVVETGFGEVAFTPPLAFQEHSGLRRPIAVAYELRGQEYGFRLGDYDPMLPVVIDPLLQATYLGGSGTDEARPVAIHPTSGDVYVAGDGRPPRTSLAQRAGHRRPAAAEAPTRSSRGWAPL